MKLEDALNKIRELRKKIHYYDELYYSGNPIISDREYDDLKKKLNVLERAYHAEENYVGYQSINTPFNKKKHAHRMFSLDKCLTPQELHNYVKRCEVLSEHIWPMIAEVKIDGLAISLTYENGILISAVTRGDGFIGEDVTNNVKEIEDIPQKIQSLNLMEVRGEVYMKNSVFSLLKSQNLHFSTARSAACGSLRQLDPRTTKERKLNFFAYDYICATSHRVSQENILQNLMRWNFPVCYHRRKCFSFSGLLNFYEEMNCLRPDLDYDIDGIVYKINSSLSRKKLGYHSTAPRYCIAYKFNAKTAVTRLENVVFQTGRNGAITPVAELSPINIGGVIVTKANLHNKQFIEKNNIHIGDKLCIAMAGDIIPRVDGVVESLEKKKISWPARCPSCNFDITHRQNIEKCLNINCSKQICLRLFHFCGVVGIDGLGIKKITYLYEYNYVKNIKDIFILDKHPRLNDLINLNGWGAKSVHNIIRNIQQVNTLSFESFLYALAIDSIGKNHALWISKKCSSFEDFINLLHTHSNIKGIGGKTWENIHQKKDYIIQCIKILSSFIKITFHKQKSQNIKIVFTGTVQNFTRSDLQKKIENLPIEVVNHVTKDVSYVVCGDNPGSKKQKAEAYNIPVMTFEQWLNTLPKSVKF